MNVYGTGCLYKRGNIFWMAFSENGRPHYESTKTGDEQKARSILRARIRKVHASEETGQPFITQKMKRVTISELCDLLEHKYEVDGALSRTKTSELKRVRNAFGSIAAVALKPADIERWKQEQLEAGYEKATINRTLTFLTRAYNSAIEDGELANAPFIRKFEKLSNRRTGFLTRPQFDKILANLPDDGLRDYCAFGFLTGMRKGEIASLRWKNAGDDEIVLAEQDAKTGDERRISVRSGELAQIFERRRKARKSFDGYIFHRGDDRSIQEFRKSWARACKLAGFPNTLFHDLRRSAIRNLIRSGVPQTICMAISGHKTISTFKRYNICNGEDSAIAMQMLERYNAEQIAKAANVVSIAN